MDFGMVVALLMIAAGLLRLVLMRTGKVPAVFGYQQYIPYVFMVVGAVLFVIALTD